jgi:PAS domain S-box-containing protein
MKIFSQRSYINILLLAALFILTGSNLLSYFQMQQLLVTNAWVIHTHEVIETATNLKFSVSDAGSEINQSIYTKNILHLPHFLNMFATVNNTMAALKKLTADNSVQQYNIDKLKPLVQQRVTILQEILTTDSDKSKQLDLILSSYSKRLELRKEINFYANKIIQQEQDLLQHRTSAFQHDVAKNNLIFMIIALLSEGLLVLSLILLNHYLTKRDIAEFKNAENEQRLRLIIDSTRDYAIIMLNPEGIVTTWSVGAEKIKGYKADEIIGKHFSIFYTKKDLAEHHIDKELEIAREEGRFEEEGWRVRKNGTQYLANVVITPLRDPKGNLVGYGKITRDLTERKEIEKMKNEFVSVVSHELRTPITSIRGALGLILGGTVGEFSEKAKKLLEIANHNCERLQLLINDILDIEKIESDKMNFDLKTVDLNLLVAEGIASNRLYGEKYGIEINLLKSDASVLVRVDTDRLIQVLTNLLSNSIKFSSKNDPVVVAVTEENGYARVAVTNQGRGISKEFQSRIFQKFSQADSSDTRSKDGSGLGLNISKAIIEKMGGTMHFTSTVSEGTTFYFELPAHDMSSDKEIVSENKDLRKNITNTLLICEDDEDQANYLQVLLESAGFQSDIAHTVADAKKLLSLNSYRMLLLDLILPDEDGISFIRELRNNEKTINLPIIVQSVIAQTGRTLLNGEAFAVLDWLDKPVDFSKLLHAINLIKTRNHISRPYILHVEDDPDTHHVIKTLLEEHADVIDATTLDSARKKLSMKKFDLVILDLLLPDGNGTELLPLLSKYKVPVIVYSAIELDNQYSVYVKQALIKSKTSNEELIELIQSAVR